MSIENPCEVVARLIGEQSEATWFEFKENNTDPESIGEYVSALANAAILAGRERAYLVFGVTDKTHQIIGTQKRLDQLKKGNENLPNWLSRMIEPRILLEFLDFKCSGMSLSMIVIEPSYDRPVRFAGKEYFRIGENLKTLSAYPEHERALWLATGRRKFEDAVSIAGQSKDDIFRLLDATVYFDLKGLPLPESDTEIIRTLVDEKMLIDNLDGRFDITNLGAILLARDIKKFSSISGKALRVIKYTGRNKLKSEFEQAATLGYAAGFARMMKFLVNRLPNEEIYIDGVRKQLPHFPETALREVISNALIHQDFTATGVGPAVEIYDNRIEVTNPGHPLLDTDRMLDRRRSRNERLAAAMQDMGLCEQRGGGLDKTLMEIESRKLPPPELIASEDGFCVVLYGPKPFGALSKADKSRACYQHAVLRWINRDFMSNTSLRERFSLTDDAYQAVSGVISEAMKSGRISPADPAQGKRHAKYIPYWAA